MLIFFYFYQLFEIGVRVTTSYCIRLQSETVLIWVWIFTSLYWIVAFKMHLKNLVTQKINKKNVGIFFYNILYMLWHVLNKSEFSFQPYLASLQNCAYKRFSNLRWNLCSIAPYHCDDFPENFLPCFPRRGNAEHVSWSRWAFAVRGVDVASLHHPQCTAYDFY